MGQTKGGRSGRVRMGPEGTKKGISVLRRFNHYVLSLMLSNVTLLKPVRIHKDKTKAHRLADRDWQE